MLKSEARVATGRASHYIKTLCNHFKGKIDDITFDDNRGDVKFPFGTCEMLASEEELVLRVEAADAEMFARAKDVVGGHLERFAYRGETITVNWVDA